MFYLLIILILINIIFIHLLITIRNSFLSLLHRFIVVFALRQGRLKMTYQTVSIFQTILYRKKGPLL